MLRRMNDLKAFTIGATDGDLGEVEAFYFDDKSFTVRYLVVNTGGWLSGRKVLISPMALRGVNWATGSITAALTKSQVEGSPDIDTDRPVSLQHEIEYYRYYGYSRYWTGPRLWGPVPHPGPTTPGSAAALDAEQPWNWQAEEHADPHLRSSATVIGYYIRATDGDIGHVEDFLVDDTSWRIRYVIVDTRNWWPGKKVLIAPGWIRDIDSNESTVRVDMTRVQIWSSPEREYEARLYGTYDRPSYWSD